MHLLIARHGNTFNAGETPYFVGRNEDLPLTIEGEAQANTFSSALMKANLRPDIILCGDLQRTRRTAEIIAETLQLAAPESDERLTEIDYGAWAGLNTTEILHQFGSQALKAWEEEAEFPEQAGWAPTPQAIAENLHNLLTDLQTKYSNGTVLLVTSNGILRFIARSDPSLFAKLRTQGLKVATGRVCRFESDDQGLKPIYWNRDPAKEAL